MRLKQFGADSGMLGLEEHFHKFGKVQAPYDPATATARTAHPDFRTLLDASRHLSGNTTPGEGLELR